MGLTGFQRRRRIMAADQAKKTDDVTADQAAAEDFTDAATEAQKTTVEDLPKTTDEKPEVTNEAGQPASVAVFSLTPEIIENFDRAELESELELRNIKFAHNAKDQSLKEKLLNAIN